jgi:hypothetical protein
MATDAALAISAAMNAGLPRDSENTGMISLTGILYQDE